MNIRDKDKAIILLSFLLDFNEYLVDILLHRKQSLTMEDVKAALDSKEIQKKFKVLQVPQVLEMV